MFLKLFFLATFLSFGNTSEGSADNWRENNVYHKEYYQTGVTKAEGWVQNGAKTGYWRFYHDNGQLASKGKYHNGQRIEYWHFYDLNGNKTQEGHYEQGQKSNWWLFYNSSGEVSSKCQMLAGIKSGYCLKYTKEKLKSAEKYQEGKKINEWFSYWSFKRENDLADLK